MCAHLGDRLTILDARTETGLSRTEEQTAALIDFVRWFGESGIKGRLLIETLHDQPVSWPAAVPV